MGNIMHSVPSMLFVNQVDYFEVDYNWNLLFNFYSIGHFIPMDTLFHCTLLGAALVDIAAINKYIVM